MTYTLSADVVDMEFQVQFHEDRFPLGYAAMMWASYMDGTVDRKIHFPGESSGEEGWITFGEDADDGFETGTISARGVTPLPYEEDAELLALGGLPLGRYFKVS